MHSGASLLLLLSLYCIGLFSYKAASVFAINLLTSLTIVGSENAQLLSQKLRKKTDRERDNSTVLYVC